MSFINNRKRRNLDNTKSLLASPILVPTIMPSKQLRSSNIHALCSDPKFSTSTRHVTTRIENKESNSLNSLAVINYNRFISMVKANKISDLSLTMSPTESTTLRQQLQNSESEERFDACCYLMRNASLIL